MKTFKQNLIPNFSCLARENDKSFLQFGSKIKREEESAVLIETPNYVDGEMSTVSKNNIIELQEKFGFEFAEYTFSYRVDQYKYCMLIRTAKAFVLPMRVKIDGEYIYCLYDRRENSSLGAGTTKIITLKNSCKVSDFLSGDFILQKDGKLVSKH